MGLLFTSSARGRLIQKTVLLGAIMKLTSYLGAAVLAATSLQPVYADESQPTMKELQQQLDALAAEMDRLTTSASSPSKLHIGGYGEMHYNNFDSGKDIDFHAGIAPHQKDFE